MFSALLLNSTTKAVYVIEEPAAKYPTICKKNTQAYAPACYIDNGTGGTGTGTLLDSKTVLTAAHVVIPKTGDRMMGDMTVTFWQNNKPVTRKVKKASFFSKRNDAFEHTYSYRYGYTDRISPGTRFHDIALLVLENPITSIKPGVMRSVKAGEKLPSISYMGFGSGGLYGANPSPLDSADAYAEFHNKNAYPAFRRVDNIKGHIKAEKYRDTLTFATFTKKAHLGSGDSGSAVLDQNGKIIGIGVGGGMPLFTETLKERQNILKDWKGKFTEYLKTNKKHRKSKEYSLAQHRIKELNDFISMNNESMRQKAQMLAKKTKSKKRSESKLKKPKSVKAKRSSKAIQFPSEKDFHEIFIRHRKQTVKNLDRYFKHDASPHGDALLTILKEAQAKNDGKYIVNHPRFKNVLFDVVLALEEPLLKKIKEVMNENRFY